MTRDDQLQWEARWAVPAAVASFGAAVLLVISATLFFPKDRKGIGRAPDLLLSIDDQSGAYIASAILTALAALLLLGVFYYLFRAVVARGGGVPHWFVYLVYAAPILYAIGSVVYAFQAIDIADEFASGTPIRGQAGVDRAKDLSDVSPLLLAAQTAGTVGVAFLFVMLPLRARRVGLLTPFMGILGAIAGALIVFQLAGHLRDRAGVLAGRARPDLPRPLARAGADPPGRAARPSRGRRRRSAAPGSTRRGPSRSTARTSRPARRTQNRRSRNRRTPNRCRSVPRRGSGAGRRR